MPNHDSPLFEEALQAYNKKKKFFESLGAAGSRPKERPVFNQEKWLETTREFYRWKKTDDYKDWRSRQFGKQEGKCYYCNDELKGVRTNVEHVVPRSKGGTNKPKNLVLACWKCNKDKGSDMLTLKRTKKLRKRHNLKQRNYQTWKADEELTGYELGQMFKED